MKMSLSSVSHHFAGQRSLTLAKPPVFDDEFIGPFPSWVNVQTECGAKGDGVTDDTAAIQRDWILSIGNRHAEGVVFPGGQLSHHEDAERAAHRHNRPSAWASSVKTRRPPSSNGRRAGRAPFLLLPWFARMMRLTLDGAGKAKDAIFHGPAFRQPHSATPTWCSRMCNSASKRANATASPNAWCCAANFIRCSETGISIQNFNTLDWWIWYSTFEDCHIGVSSQYHKGGGHFSRLREPVQKLHRGGHHHDAYLVLRYPQ